MIFLVNPKSPLELQAVQGGTLRGRESLNPWLIRNGRENGRKSWRIFWKGFYLMTPICLQGFIPKNERENNSLLSSLKGFPIGE